MCSRNHVLFSSLITYEQNQFWWSINYEPDIVWTARRRRRVAHSKLEIDWRGKTHIRNPNKEKSRSIWIFQPHRKRRVDETGGVDFSDLSGHALTLCHISVTITWKHTSLVASNKCYGEKHCKWHEQNTLIMHQHCVSNISDVRASMSPMLGYF